MRLDGGMTEIRDAALGELLGELGVDPAEVESTITVVGQAPVLPTPLRAAEAGTLALAAQACTMSLLSERRGGVAQDAWIDPRDAVFALNPFLYFRRNGRVSRLFDRFEARPHSGRFLTSDDRQIVFGALLPRNRDRLAQLLEAANRREAVAEAVRSWKAEELEDAVAEAGVPVTVLRTNSEWRDSEQGKLVAASRLGRVDRLGQSDPMPLPAAAQPLAGVRVLDMTHVVAGPTITRGLAEYGADVLHLCTLNPDLQDELEVAIQLGIGKRSTQIELDDPSDRVAFERLLRTADVFVQSWRPGVLQRHGYPPERIAELSPGIVQLSVSAYGDVGPWGRRAGYDGLALASIGAALQEQAWRKEAELRRPDSSAAPRYRGLLTDSLTGILGSVLVASLLMRRAVEGGSYRADLTLAGVGTWLQDLGAYDPEVTVTETLGEPRLRRIQSCFGTLEYVAPAIRYSRLDPFLSRPPEPVGSAQPVWADQIS
jgi:CoA-transferase family III